MYLISEWHPQRDLSSILLTIIDLAYRLDLLFHIPFDLDDAPSSALNDHPDLA